MRYAGILENDFVNGEGVCVSFWAQGCPHHCPGCHNPQTWDFSGGLEASEEEIINKVISAISKNGIKRNFSVLGGEPLCGENIEFVAKLISKVKQQYPDIKIFVWTGYECEDLLAAIDYKDSPMATIFNNSYMLATGQFIKEKRDVSLKFVGSTNQKVIYLNK